ncbi:hypothetical protein ACFP1I_23445 [Dyadobacter subterraneus]|uniref:Uncharacterized protein n=1 Tax=Dyadobacter subterraneus TaxID=2773304 RepID=A0ABR9WCH7_9BACT|nr:hypothetical protein [Dyadobacter subterraneus]MBE9461944.1 hypothetical protein [Dyadobacter subterraneus]
MNFKGGVIIIGSLLWEETPIRQKWKALNLQSVDFKQMVSVPIRYGRQSSMRSDTFTIIFSNHISTQKGQAYILGFKERIKNANNLQSQAFALGAVEGFWETENPSINKRWGTVGLLINPNIDLKDKKNADVIRNWWTKLYQTYTETFDNSQYRIEDSEAPVIDKNGFLQIPWTSEMDDFDFLIATPIAPKPHKLLTSKEIALQMIAKNYRTYFDKNRENKIHTFQDLEILKHLDK